jgi:hypothetical protein
MDPNHPEHSFEDYNWDRYLWGERQASPTTKVGTDQYTLPPSHSSQADATTLPWAELIDWGLDPSGLRSDSELEYACTAPFTAHDELGRSDPQLPQEGTSDALGLAITSDLLDTSTPRNHSKRKLHQTDESVAKRQGIVVSAPSALPSLPWPTEIQPRSLSREETRSLGIRVRETPS